VDEITDVVFFSSEVVSLTGCLCSEELSGRLLPTPSRSMSSCCCSTSRSWAEKKTTPRWEIREARSWTSSSEFGAERIEESWVADVKEVPTCGVSVVESGAKAERAGVFDDEEGEGGRGAMIVNYDSR
jgi:hypothetical protein